MAEAAEPDMRSRQVPLILVAWLVAAIALVWFRWPSLWADGPVGADSTMRLVQVRDFLAGQGWFDTVQHRLGPPDGASLHWSRLIDAPLAGLVLLFDMMAPSRWTAEMLAATAWPLILLLGLMAASASIAVTLGGRVAALLAAVLALQSGPAILHFLPGALDHHNVQIVLSLAFAAAILCADRHPAAGIGAGIAAALMLAIGVETLPVIATGTVVLVLAWLFEPARFAAAARGYGVALAAVTLACLAATRLPADWLDPGCDALSATYAGLAAAGGFGLALFTLLLGPRSSLGHRIAAVAGLGAICVAMTVVLSPNCLDGPLGAVDPRIRGIWYDRMAATASLRELFDTDFATAVAIVAVPVIAFAASMVFLARADDTGRYRWAAAALFAGAGLLSMALHSRAAAGAGAMAVPIVACLATRIARRRPAERASVSLPLLVAIVPFVSFLAWHLAATALVPLLASRFDLAQAQTPAAVEPQCLGRSAFGELASLDKTVVLSQTGLGPAILAYTDHEAVAGNHHRSADGIIDTYDAFSSSGDVPAPVFARRGVGLVVVCHGGADGTVGDPALVAGLLGRLKRGEVPAWLEPVFVGDRLLAYRVTGP